MAASRVVRAVEWAFSVGFCKLPSGRILTALKSGGFSVRYSDDEGAATWRPLTTPPGKFEIYKIIATPDNEVFVGAANVGVFYSNNGGQTWDKRNGLPGYSFWGRDLLYKVVVSFLGVKPVTLTFQNDKGVNWQQINPGTYGGFTGACSMSDGTILAISNNQLIRSIDGGNNWAPVYTR